MDDPLFRVLKPLLVIASFAVALGIGLYLAHKHSGKNKGGLEWLVLFQLEMWHLLKRSFRAPLILVCWGIIIIGLIVWLFL